MSSWKITAERSTSGTSPRTIRKRQPLGDRGLADAGVADEQRVVLGAPAEDLDRALDLEVAADQDVDLALLGLGVEVGAVGAERLARLAGAPLPLLGLLGAAHPAALGHAGALGDAVADVVDGIEPRHVLLLQEIDRVRTRAPRTAPPARWRR